ncbi:MAG: hypothetical protein K0Q97_1307 [Bacillota bacterium]|jgi:hypothetical protein|nr:hypothetical protein [Bacillota bacterium]
MYKNSFQNENDNYKLNPYRAKNMIIKKAEVTPSQPAVDTLPQEIPAEQTPETPAVDVPESNEIEITIQPSYGSASVGVFTALGALPVKDAVVTIYLLDENAEEVDLYFRVTDESGRVEDMQLAVFYDPTNPLVSPEFYFTTYNMRIQAFNYYTQNILDFRVFPGVKTNLRINLIPVIQGENQETAPEQTIIIPPSPIDISN